MRKHFISFDGIIILSRLNTLEIECQISTLDKGRSDIKNYVAASTCDM